MRKIKNDPKRIKGKIRNQIIESAPVVVKNNLQEDPNSKSNSPSSAFIGVYLQRHLNKQLSCASDRIRGEWIIKNSDKMEIFNPDKNYEVVIFHIPCEDIAKYGRIKILDICDNIWEPHMQGLTITSFTQLIEPIDVIIVPTEQLKKELLHITNKPIHIIPDRHDFSHYNTKYKNLHVDRAKEAVWFGYAQNGACLAPLINYIKSVGLKLKVISQDQNIYPLEHADTFIKWDVNTYIHEISKCDFAILPFNKPHKSNNKDITALLSGIPVAKTKEDISRLMIPEQRKLEIINHRNELTKYDSRKSTEEYLNIINSIKKGDVVQVYSSINGKIDKPRQDIKVFTDSSSDMFKLPVMNAKIYKILSHKYFSSNFTVYLDGNIFLKVDPSKLLDEMLKDADIALFKHPFRNCLYQEHLHAKHRVLPPYKVLMDEQVARYQSEGMPTNFGLGECGMLIRRNNEATQEFNERWWAEICRYTNRDQMSFPYVLWKMKDRIKVNFIQDNVRKNPYFTYKNH